MLDLSDKKERGFLEKMHEFNQTYQGGIISWTYVQRDPKKGPTFVKMGSRPCYGEMRAYGPESTRPGDPKPWDLTRPIKPANEENGIKREAVSVFFGSLDPSDEHHNNILENFFFAPDSPWRRGFSHNGLEFTRSSDGRIKGIVMYETDIDPTAMVSLFMNVRSYFRTDRARMWAWLKSQGLTPVGAFLATQYINYCPRLTKDLKRSENFGQFSTNFGFSYTLPQRPDIRRLLTGEVRDLSNGRTWRDGEDYNRPQIQDLFLEDGEGGSTFIKKIADKLDIHLGSPWSQNKDEKTYNKLIEGIDTAVREVQETL